MGRGLLAHCQTGTKERMTQRGLSQNEDISALVVDSSDQECLDEGGDPSAVLDTPEDSSAETSSVGSEVADPSWMPSPIAAPMRGRPRRASARGCPEGRPKRPFIMKQKSGALRRSLALRSRTGIMGNQKPSSRARRQRPPIGGPCVGPQRRFLSPNEGPTVSLPRRSEEDQQRQQWGQKRPLPL